MSVADIINDQDEEIGHTHSFMLWPRKWSEVSKHLSSFSWITFQLHTLQRSHIPKKSGIYTLVVRPQLGDHPYCSYVMYIGKTNSLHRRFGEYLNEKKRETGRPKLLRLLNKYPDHIWFCFTEIAETQITTVEDALVAALKPPFNDKIPAQIRSGKAAF